MAKRKASEAVATISPEPPDFSGEVELSNLYMVNPTTGRSQITKLGDSMPSGFAFNGRLVAIRKQPDATVVLSVERHDGVVLHFVYWSEKMWGEIQ